MATNNYKTSNRAPFEIRTEFLQMAQDYLQRQFEVQNEFARAAFLETMKAGMTMQADWEKFAPKYFNFDEILEKAEELYDFAKTE